MDALCLALTDDMKICQPNSFLITRYVDDILVFSVNEPEICVTRELAFKTCPELTFTTEEPSKESLQHLDLKLPTSGSLSSTETFPENRFSPLKAFPKHVKAGIINTLTVL